MSAASKEYAPQEGLEDLVAAMALGGPIAYLHPEEARKIEEREGYGLSRAWEAWRRRALPQP